MKHAVPYQKKSQSGVAIDKKNCQDRVDQIFPGQPCNTQCDDSNVTVYISERAARCIGVCGPCFDTIHAITNNRSHQQPEGNLELRGGKQEETEAEEYGGIRKQVRADPEVREDIGTDIASELAESMTL